MTDGDKVLALRIALMGVATCFRSRTQSSTCINDHHPCCAEYITSVLARVDKDEGVDKDEEVMVEEKDNDDIKFWLAVSDMNKELQCDKG